MKTKLLGMEIWYADDIHPGLWDQIHFQDYLDIPV